MISCACKTTIKGSSRGFFLFAGFALGILEFLASLRKFRHCEALKKPKQSHSKFSHCRNSVIASEQRILPSLRGFKKAEAISRNSRIPKPCVIPDCLVSSPDLTRGSLLYGILEFPASLRGSKATEAISYKIPSLRGRILNFSGVLGAAAPKGLGRSPYKICELGLSSLKASKILEFLK